jgi:hypothetical protein
VNESDKKTMGPTSPKNPKPISALILCIRVFKAFIGRRKKERRRKQQQQQLVLSSKDNKQAGLFVPL